MSTVYEYDDIYTGSHRSPRRWSAKHDVIHHLVPFDHFTTNPWDQLETLQTFLRELPDTASTWRFRDTPGLSAKLNHTERIQVLTDIVGAWPITKEATLGTLWVNPHYPKLEHVEWVPDEHKMTHWLRTALVGKWTMRELSGRYGQNDSVLYTMFKHRGLTFGEAQAYGRQRLANTVTLTTEWTDMSVRACSRRLDVAHTTLRRWIDKHGTLDPVPERPSESGIGASW